MENEELQTQVEENKNRLVLLEKYVYNLAEKTQRSFGLIDRFIEKFKKLTK